MSMIWKHFIAISSIQAQCRYCPARYNTKKTTSALRYHLKNKHPDKVHSDTQTEDLDSDDSDSSDTPTNSSDSNKRKRAPQKTYYSRKNPKFESITASCVKMIALDMLPLAFVEGDGFLQFMKTVCPDYTIPSRTVIQNRLSVLYDFVKKEIITGFKNFSFVSITTDAWTSLSTKSFLTITVHAIDDLYNLRSFTLDTLEMPESHTAINLHKHISTSLKKWNIFEKTVAVVHDNAANMVATMRLDSEITPKFAESVRCFSHSLQCAIATALKEKNLNDCLHKVSAIVGHFKHSNIATDSLTNAQKELNLPTHRLVAYCVTRWNSAYFMIERVLEQRLAIELVLNKRSITSLETQRKLSLRNCDWTYLKSIMKILKPFNVATNLMNSETNSTIAMVRPIIHSIISNFLQPDDQDSESVLLLKETLEEQLQTRFLPEQSPELFGIACFLDPRYKDLREETPEFRSKIQEKVLELIREEDNQVATQTGSKSNQRERDIDYLFNPDSLSQSFERSVSFNGNDDDRFALEVANYKAEAIILKADNPLVWWNSKKHKFPSLTRLAKKYLCIPSTSTPSERVFSTAGNVISAKRSCLSSNAANMLIFLYQNRSITEKCES